MTSQDGASMAVAITELALPSAMGTTLDSLEAAVDADGSVRILSLRVQLRGWSDSVMSESESSIGCFCQGKRLSVPTGVSIDWL